jgi:phage terminase large subunit
MKVNKNLAELLKNHEAQDRKYYVSCVGSTRSGKSWSIIEYMMMCSIQMPGLISDVFRFDQRRHDGGVQADFLSLMQTKYQPAWKAGKWNKQMRTFTFHNNSVIRFLGTQDEEKLHGPARDIAFFNECNEHTINAFNQITMRTRLLVLCDCNPVDMDHPILKVLSNSPNCLHVHTTYKDNPHLSPNQIRVIESYNPDVPENVLNGTADKYMHEVYALGRPARREGAVFGNWEITDEWPGREFCERSSWGIDFGFTMDPSTLIAAKVHGRMLYLREYIYEHGLLVAPPDTAKETPSLIGRMRDMIGCFHPSDWIYCDSAQPESIRQLQIAGFHVQAVKKGPGSVLAGIQRMKRFQIKVHRGSTNLQREFRMYSWRRRPDGSYADEPEDKFNHCIDAARYSSTEFKITNNSDPIYVPEQDRMALLMEQLRARHSRTIEKLQGRLAEDEIRI